MSGHRRQAGEVFNDHDFDLRAVSALSESNSTLGLPRDVCATAKRGKVLA